MKLNTDKCNKLESGEKYAQIWAQIGIDRIWEEKQVKLLGITIDTELKFETHISNLCNKGNQKLSVPSRLRKILTLKQRKVVFKSFFESQFKYCPLIWMFCSRKTNNKINKLHERALRVVHNDNDSSFENLLERDHSFCIHHQNIQTLAIEMYKINYGLAEGSERPF